VHIFLITGLVICGVFAGWMFFARFRNFVVGGLVSAIAGYLVYTELGKNEPSYIVVYMLGAIILGWVMAAALRIFFAPEDDEAEVVNED